MARLIDLAEDEEVEPEADCGGELQAVVEHDDRPNPNIGPFSAALTCYPIVSQLASNLDLVTLHELSRTCRQFRVNLLQYRTLLIEQALRCDNENANPAARLGNALHASLNVWTAYGRDGVKVGRITSGKVGACARDLVGECRRCGIAVCRNCIMKALPSTALKGRYRRLCRTCMKSPMDRLTVITRCVAPEVEVTEHFETKDMARTPCTCQAGEWICQPCGQSLRPADTTYARGWAWRTRYSAFNGMGAGLGEGNEGVECGRGSDCLAAKEVEQEIECDVDDPASLESEIHNNDFEGRHWHGSSYTTQEVVGIGGKVKKKVKKRVLVGCVVKEYEDERVDGKFLVREQNGTNRSWCSWCERVVMGKKDMERPVRSTDSIASSSSSGSA